MAYYTNEKSLKDTYGDKEVAGLLRESSGEQSEARLAKAAATAYAEINALLFSSDYIIPPFVPYGEALDPLLPDVGYINPVIQSVSDCFTAFHLSQSTDLSKKPYENCRANWLAYLKEDPLAPAQQIVVVSRPQVFTQNMKTQQQIFNNFFYNW